jgi:hypothetical protein
MSQFTLMRDLTNDPVALGLAMVADAIENLGARITRQDLNDVGEKMAEGLVQIGQAIENIDMGS